MLSRICYCYLFSYIYDLFELFFIQMHCIFIDLDDRGNPIPRIDVNKLID